MAINLLVQSQNIRDIDIIDITTFTKTQIVNNQTSSLPYNNYIIDLHTSSSSFTMPNFWLNLTSLEQNALFIFIVLVLLCTVFLTGTFLKSWSK